MPDQPRQPLPYPTLTKLLGPTPHDQRFWRALVLSPNITVFEALLRGEDVPVSSLDPLWSRRFGITT